MPQHLPATHLAYATYPESIVVQPGNFAEGSAPAPIYFTDEPITIQAFLLGGDGLPLGEQTITLFSQPDPPGCQTDSIHPSPNSQFLILQYNCYAGSSALFLNLTDPNYPATSTP